MKRFFVLMMSLLIFIGLQAQVIAYGIQTSTYVNETTVIDLQGTVGKDLSKTLLDNDGNITFNTAEEVSCFPIGFDFNYNGCVMKHFVLTGDGAVLLSEAKKITTAVHTTTSPANSLTTKASKNMLGAIVSDGAYGCEDTEISYTLSGFEGQRVLTIRYKNLGIQSSASDVTTEVAKAHIEYRLMEATGNIEMTVSGMKPYDGADTGKYSWMRIGIVGDPGDYLFLKRYDARGVEDMSTKDATVKYDAENYPPDGTTWIFQAPEPCQTPAVAPSALVLTSTTTQMKGSFMMGDADHYLVLLSKEAELTEMPVDRTKYRVGQTLGNAVVAAVVTEGSFESADDLTDATDYHVFVFGYNSLCTAGPLYNATPAMASMKTKPAAPKTITFSNVDKNNMSISVTPMGELPVLLAVTDEQATNKWGEYMESGNFGIPSGSYDVNDSIEGGGKVIFMGQPAEAVNLNGLVAGTPYYFRAWSSDGHGGYSSTYVDGVAATAAVLPWATSFDEKVGYNANLPGWTKNNANDWASEQDGFYIYSIANDIEDETVGAISWIETPDIYLGDKGTKLKTTIGGMARQSWLFGDWELGDKDKIVFQVTADGETYRDVLTIDKTVTTTLSADKQESFTVFFSDYANQKVRLRIYIQRFSVGQTRIGLLSLAERSDCEAPLDVKMMSVGATTATVGWTPIGEEGTWEVSYKKTDAAEWSEPMKVNTPQVLLEGLTSATTYEVRVRACCSAEKVSAWTEEVSIKTLYSVPFEMNFDADDLSEWGCYTGELSENTELTEGGDVVVGEIWGRLMHLFDAFSSESHSWLVSPVIVLGDEDTNEYQVSLTLKTERSATDAHDFTIRYVVAQEGEHFSSSNVFGTIKVDELPAGDEQTIFTKTLKGFVGKVRIGFYFSGTTGQLPSLSFNMASVKEAAPSGVRYVNIDGADSETVYDLNGVRKLQQAKGLNIIDGKKVIRK